MVANIRCAEIAADQLAALQEDQAWRSLREAAAEGVVPAFGARAGALISSSLAGATTLQLLIGPLRQAARRLWIPRSSLDHSRVPAACGF